MNKVMNTFYKKNNCNSNFCLYLIFIVLFSVATLAGAKGLEFGAGIGTDDNIFYTSTQEVSETFGQIDISFSEKFEISNSDWNYEIDASYDDKHFFSESEARDLFLSGFMEVYQQGDSLKYGLSFDPQYMQFVTSDTEGGLILPGKQRITAFKTRLYGELEFSDKSIVEVGIMLKQKKYKDSSSDYDGYVGDLNYKCIANDVVSFDFGGSHEERDYDTRLSRTQSGSSVSGTTLEISRTNLYAKITLNPSERQRLSLKFNNRDNKDDFEDYYSHTKNTVKLRWSYLWDNNVKLKAKLKMSTKEYDEQIGDDGKSLEEDKTSVDLELHFPFDKFMEGMTGVLAFENDDYESNIIENEYKRNSYSFSIYKKF